MTTTQRPILVGALALALLAPFVSPAAAEREVLAEGRAVLVLAGGGSRQVEGPVVRDGGLILFHDRAGQLLSVRAGLVTRVEPAVAAEPSAAAPAPASASPRPAAAPSPFGERYTNADLPEVPASPAPAPASDEVGEAEATPAPPAAEEPAPAEAAVADPLGEAARRAGVPIAVPSDTTDPEEPVAETAAVEVPLVETPVEVQGRPESWWREEAARRRAAIAAIEQEQNLHYRLLICAQNGIPLEQGKCFPMINRLPKVNRAPRTPTERSLAAKLADATARLEQARADLAAFLDRAMTAGAPTEWMLER